MQIYLIKNIQVINEGRIQVADVLIKNGRIEKIGPGNFINRYEYHRDQW